MRREMAAGTSAGEQHTRRVMGARRAPAVTPSTPVPSWSVFNGQLYDGVMAARGAPPASARKLAASLRELQLLHIPLPASAPRSPEWPSRQDSQREDFGVSAQTREHLRKLLRKTATVEESVERKKTGSAMEEGARTMSQELLKVFSQIRVLEEEHSASLSLTSALHAELVAAQARVRELEGVARREKKERARVVEENRRLARELADARAELESERRQRRLMEEVCEELAQESCQGGGNNAAAAAAAAEAEAETQKVREDLEEERRMLQLAEVWREERVQMKLGEAKLALEEKSAALDAVKEQLESFLRASSSDTHLRDAQVLHEVIHAISSFPTSAFVPESSSQARRPRKDAPAIPDAG